MLRRPESLSHLSIFEVISLNKSHSVEPMCVLRVSDFEHSRSIPYHCTFQKTWHGARFIAQLWLNDIIEVVEETGEAFFLHDEQTRNKKTISSKNKVNKQRSQRSNQRKLMKRRVASPGSFYTSRSHYNVATSRRKKRNRLIERKVNCVFIWAVRPFFGALAAKNRDGQRNDHRLQVTECRSLCRSDCATENKFALTERQPASESLNL